MALPPVFIAFIGDYTGLKESAQGVKRELAEVDAEGSASLKGLGAVGTGVMLGMGAAMVGTGYEALKLGTAFNSTMTQLNTQAHVPLAQVQQLSVGVEKLAGQVGFSPDSLAESLYHVESSFASTGITGEKALDILHVAADGAAVGHANLVDTQNALDAAIASGIPGVEDYSQAMGALNAIVGSGDMQMQDLADALGTGVLAVVKGYGITLADTGAALATFGDNNIRGADAATDLRMSVQALAVPAKEGADVLAKLGLKSDTLAKDMQKGGLKLALNDLVEHMHKAGVGADQMGDVITQVFGKKAGAGLAVLAGQLDRFNSKYPELEKGAVGFGDAVAQNQATLAQKEKDAQAALESLGVSIGTKLLPVATEAMGVLSKGIGWLSQHQGVFSVMASGISALGIAMGVAKVATIEWNATLLANPAVWIAAAIVALGAAIYYAYKHSATFRNVIDDVGKALKTGFSEAMHLAGEALHWFESGPLVSIKNELKVFAQFWHDHGQQIIQVAKAVWAFVKSIMTGEAKVAFDMIMTGLKTLKDAWTFTWDLIKNAVKTAWDLIGHIIQAGINLILDAVGFFLDLLQGKWSKLGGDAKKLIGDAIHGIYEIFDGFAKDALHLLEQAGKDVVQGLINGIKSGFGLVKNIAKDLGNTAKNAFHDIMGIFSPSRVMYQSGAYVVQGLVNALTDGKSMVGAAASALGSAVLAGFGSPSLTLGARGLVGGVPTGLGTYGSGSGSVFVSNTVHVVVEGTVKSEHDLRDTIQEQMLQLGGRNAATWAPARV